MQSKQRILIAPLDWGLGHATRCIPIIRLLLKKEVEVIIAADGRPLELLKKEFPELEFICFKGYSINYPDKGSMVLKMLFSIPKIFTGIYREHQALKKIIDDKKIDIVISDNRFGLWNNNVKSIFMTHQLMIKSPFAEGILHKINLFFINKYNECWVPDEEGTINLSGDLSHKYPLPRNTFFIGALSRFQKQKELTRLNYEVMAMVSGPEPQRTIFETMITEQLLKTNLKALVVCGKADEKNKKVTKGNLEIINHLNANEMQEAILQSEIIIARSGYSTIMDLATLGKKAIFIPTPGQTEQEYLAELLQQKKISYTQIQSEINIEEAIIKSKDYKGFEHLQNNIELEKRVDLLIKNP
jgi:predicted glycosyltransferase